MTWKIFRDITAIILIVAGSLFASICSAAPEETPEQAIQRYTIEIQRNPNNADAYFHRGKAYGDTKQYESAVVFLEEHRLGVWIHNKIIQKGENSKKTVKPGITQQQHSRLYQDRIAERWIRTSIKKFA